MVFLFNVYSQSSDSTLVKTGKNYTLNQKSVSHSQLKNIYSSYPEALKEYEQAKSFKTTGNIMMWGGLTYAAVSNLLISIKRENDYTEWFNSQSSIGIPGEFDDYKYTKQKLTHVGIGLGISAVGLIFIFSATDHYEKAINLYNTRHKDVSSVPFQFDLMINSNGMGIRMRF
jgi:hypothetical protein